MDLNITILQQMDVAAVCLPLQRLRKSRQRVPVELVVSQNIDDRRIGKFASRPFPSLTPQVNVACQNDHICVGWLNFHRPEFQMEVAKNVQTHLRIEIEYQAGIEVKARTEAFAFRPRCPSAPTHSAGHQQSIAFSKGCGEEAVHLLIFDQAKLPQHRYADETTGQLLDRKELVDELKDPDVIGFFRIN